MVKFSRSDVLINKFVVRLNTTLLVGCSIFVGRIVKFCRSDGGRLNNFFGQMVHFVGQMNNFFGLDGRFLLVGWSSFVGRMNNFCLSDEQLFLVG